MLINILWLANTWTLVTIYMKQLSELNILKKMMCSLKLEVIIYLFYLVVFFVHATWHTGS